jgi:hypothetical protein
LLSSTFLLTQQAFTAEDDLDDVLALVVDEDVAEPAAILDLVDIKGDPALVVLIKAPGLDSKQLLGLVLLQGPDLHQLTDDQGPQVQGKPAGEEGDGDGGEKQGSVGADRPDATGGEGDQLAVLGHASQGQEHGDEKDGW